MSAAALPVLESVTPEDISISSLSTSTTVKPKNEEEICENWEQLDSGKIEKSLQSIKLEKNKNTLINDDEKTLRSTKTPANASTSSSSIFNNQPQQPIKILKRPPSNKKLNELTQNSANAQQSQPIKTFEQREQEYAQARLRILGSAHPEEDPVSNKLPGNNSASAPQFPIAMTNNMPPTFHQMPTTINSNNQYSSSTSLPYEAANSSRSYSNNNPNSQQNSNNASRSSINLIREPMCPDGTKGFKNFNS